jgi:histone-lysine N-methyltransferase SETMAR
MSEVYCKTLKKNNKRLGILTCGVVLLHGNTRPHTSTVARTRALWEYFNWELFGHPPSSPDLASSDYHLFTYLKNWLRSQRFNNNEELMEDIKTWLSSQAADLTQAHINLFPDMTNGSVPAMTTLGCG